MKLCAKIFTSKLDNSQNSLETKFNIDQFECWPAAVLKMAEINC